MKQLLLLLYFSCLPFLLSAQVNYTISGYIKDAANGEELIGATLTLKDNPSKGTTTNVYGFYSLTLPAGNYELNYNYLGYETVSRQVELDQDLRLDVELSSQEVQLEEVTIAADRPEANVQDVKMSREELKIEKVKSLPALFGEVDVLRVVQLLPGVQTVGEGTTGLFVRGGSSDQNLVLLDEAVVYNPSHFLGFFSVFNPDAIKNLELYKGGIPARFGGRISSILDIQMKDGNKKKLSLSGGIGSISSRLTVEGPLKKDESSFILSGRRTYADLFLRLSPDEDINQNILYFYDFNAKANYRVGEKNRFFLSGYFGRDRFGISDLFGLNWGNATATLRWNHLISDRLFLNTSLIYSNFDYGFDFDTDIAEFTWQSGLLAYNAKFDFNYFLNPENSIDFGYQTIYHTFAPPSIIPGEGTNFQPLELDEKFALEQAVYIGNQQQINERLSLEYGLRYSVFQQIGPGTVYEYEEGQPLSDETITNTLEYDAGENIQFYDGLEPRFGARYLLNPRSSVKLSYNRMMQYLQIASNATAGLPIDRWIPADRYIRPLIGDQIAAGYFRNFASNTIEASVEVYYKWMENIIDFKSGSDILLNNNIETEVSEGVGWAYGTEFMVKKDVGRTTGWVSYTLSRARRRVEDINGGRAYNARYDRTHDFSLVLSHQMNPRLTLSGTWVYSSGTAVSLPSGRYRVDGQSIPFYDPLRRNAYRMPDFHRMDLSVVLEGKKKEGRRWEDSWSFSVYNAYARKNPFTITFEEVYNEDPDFEPEDGEIVSSRQAAVKTYLFSIIPSVTYNFKF
ncbi:MAG: TonB-dependent receptor [Cyclobacteriaceae bacterium]